jgi:UrcA family protein
MSISTLKSAGFGVAASIAATAALLLSSAPVLAAGDEEVMSVKVRFGDLDLTTTRGTRMLYLRLTNAARTVCDDRFDVLDLEAAHDIRKCEQTATENAVAQIDRPRLTALYNKRFPREPLLAPVRVSYTLFDDGSSDTAKGGANSKAVEVIMRRG